MLPTPSLPPLLIRIHDWTHKEEHGRPHWYSLFLLRKGTIKKGKAPQVREASRREPPYSLSRGTRSFVEDLSPGIRWRSVQIIFLRGSCRPNHESLPRMPGEAHTKQILVIITPRHHIKSFIFMSRKCPPFTDPFFVSCIQNPLLSKYFLLLFISHIVKREYWWKLV